MHWNLERRLHDKGLEHAIFICNLSDFSADCIVLFSFQDDLLMLVGPVASGKVKYDLNLLPNSLFCAKDNFGHPKLQPSAVLEFQCLFISSSKCNAGFLKFAL